MGYTHYWYRPQVLDEAKFGEWIEDVQAIISASAAEVPVAREYDAPGTSPVVSMDEVRFNGIGEDGHETFLIRRDYGTERYTAPDESGRLFSFCKTANKPYDAVVTACLIAFKDRFGDAVKVSSDGDWSEWEEGRDLYNAAGLVNLRCPFDEEPEAEEPEEEAREITGADVQKLIEEIGAKAHEQEREGMTRRKAGFDAELVRMGVVDPAAPCVVVIEDGAKIILLTERRILTLEDLYSFTTGLGSRRVETVGHMVLGADWKGMKFDAWFDDDGLYHDDRKPTLVTRRGGETLCGPVVLTSSNEAGETVALDVSDAVAAFASDGFVVILPAGLPWKKPEPGFKVTPIEN